jgi:8-amino-7-oxononanoate synthase
MIDFSRQLDELRSRGIFRELRPVESAQGVRINFEPRSLLNFSSNDYLGLSQHAAVKEAAIRAVEKFGAGSGASRLLGGSLAPHHELEETLAKFEGTEAALSFSSGYTAALGTIPALVGPHDVVILDKLSHASLVDAARLSRSIMRVYPHNHLGKLESHLEWARENHPDATILIVTESVFSMDGDTACLSQIVELRKRYGALLLLDEAHATGVIGENGRGLSELAGAGRDVDIKLGTLSKAAGASGGFIAGSRELVDYLLNRARSFIYSTAPTPAAAAAATVGMKLIASAEGKALREKLWERIRQLSESLPEILRSDASKPESAIFAFRCGDERAAASASAVLQSKGFYVPAVRYPSVAMGTARLRATVTAQHEPGEIEQLARALDAMQERFRPAAGE